MRALPLVLLLLSSPAMAGKTDPTWNPPARFDHAFAGQVTIHRLPQMTIVDVCANLIGKRSFIQHGCSRLEGNLCTVWIVNKTYMDATPEAVLRHEIGHCNGWPASHPD